MTPEGWTVNYLSDLAIKISDGIHTTPKYADQSDIYFINGNNLKNGTIEFGASTKNIPLDEFEKHKKELSDRTILMSINGTIGNLAYYKYEKVVLGKSAAYINIKNDTNKNFIYYVLSSEETQNYFLSELSGSTIRNLSLKSIKSTPIKTPPLSEQTKIAKILSTWDKAITTTERLLANSQQQKQALMQQLLTGQKRFAGFSGAWDTRKISEISTRIQRKSDGNEHPILTISSLSGFVTQEEKYSRYMAGESVNNYIQLNQDEFAYNKGNSKTYQYGCIFKLDSFATGLVPHVYVCFKLNQGFDPEYYSQLFAADYLKDQLAGLVNTGVRNNGLLNIKPSAFLETTVPVPPLAEQQKIAQVLSTADAEITNLQAQLAKLKLEKKALMQQLLTGQRRVKLDADAAA